MKKFAICGNIASGKSTVQNILLNKGYKVLDTDEISHKLLTINNNELFENFKDYDVFENGEFSRQKVGQLIFNDENLREKIGSIMHPQITKEINYFFEQNKNEKFVFVGIPLLFEAKMEKMFDKIIFIYTNDNIRLKRLLKRNNYTLEHAQSRMNSQLSQDEKIKKSDYIIYNNDSLENLEYETEKVLKTLEFNLV